ncbi:crotonase/enoyl-CoA hydratase family protein [Bradyrhizobium sp. CCBAU 45384]|uniref:crotonase/enoyl-CoA hydratase family protein n=1 Tax=Bradyrhizobium sp. CCBAU 45384 TaxID=858428 RepID=UPI0023055F2F|nr:crotonase/enoyl-CoA hydratase family protein [Bradyrhizobium sp. CCBAU 45384]
MASDRVTVTVEETVADVRLNRPEKMNALDPPMFEALAAVGDRLSHDTKIRAIVLSGEGRAFCAGLDVERLDAISRGESLLPFADLTLASHGIANWAQHVVWLWRQLPVPVIAAVHGLAFGGGFQIALGADIRYVAPGTKLAVLESKWGLVPDMSGTQLMRHLASEDVVRELTYTGRIFSPEEALSYRLITRVVDQPYSAAMKTARDIASQNPFAIRAAKRLLNEAVACDAATGLASERREQQALIGSPNHIEAVAANVAGRAAEFADPEPALARHDDQAGRPRQVSTV